MSRNSGLRRALALCAAGLCCELAAGADAAAPQAVPALSPEVPAKAPGEPVLTPEQITQAHERRAALFQPFRTTVAALSPDGKFLAYSLRDGETLSVVVVETANLSVAKTKVAVATDKESTKAFADTRERAVASIRWMKWVTPTRLVVETNRNFALGVFKSQDLSAEATEPKSIDDQDENPWQNVTGEILAFNADGSDGRVLLTPKDIEEERFDMTPPTRRPQQFRPDRPASEVAPQTTTSDETSPGVSSTRTPRSPHIFELCADDPESVLVQVKSSRGYDLYKLNVVTGKLRQIEEEVLDPDLIPLIDRQGKPRIALRGSRLAPFPHRFLFDRQKAFSRWTDLDVVAGREKRPLFQVSPENFFGQRAIPLGFEEDADVLYFASNADRDTFGIYALNVKTGQRLEQAIEHPAVDLVAPEPLGYARGQPLVYDRFDRHVIGVRYEEAVETTLWLRPDWKTLQQALEKSLPGRSVQILEWDKTSEHFLVFARGASDPGAFYLMTPGKHAMSQFAERSPKIAPETLAKTVAFAFAEKSGIRISGLLTIPAFSRMKPMPLVVVCPDDPWRRVSSDFNPEIQALANMGVAVAQINLRGAWGFGILYREAIKDGYERAQVDDIIATIDFLAKRGAVNAKRVALFGRARGAYLALRAGQLRPERFRCVIAMEPTVDLPSWLNDARWNASDPGPELTRAMLGARGDLKNSAIVDQPEPVTCPAQFIVYPGPRGGNRTQAYLDVRRLCSRMDKENTPYERVEVDDDFIEGMPNARAEAFRRVEDFLNTQLYSYDVKLGETKEVKDQKSSP